MATYEISMSGAAPDPVVDRRRGTSPNPNHGPQTRLHLSVRDVAGLEAALRRVADLGLELLAVRRTQGQAPPGTRSGPGAAPAAARSRRGDLTFEVRVRGRVGPVLLRAIPHAQASCAHGQETVVVQAPDARALAEALRTLLAPTDRLESVRLAAPVTSGAQAPPTAPHPG